jgi:hypothetical protein
MHTKLVPKGISELMLKNGLCRYLGPFFVLCADFSSVFRNVASVTLAVFLIISSYTLHHMNPGRATHSTNKKQGKSEKQIICSRV